MAIDLSDKDCENVTNMVETVKSAVRSRKTILTNDIAIQGQVSIGDVCISDLQIISISGNLDPAKYEIKSNSILFKNVLEFIVTDIDNRESKVEILRKYLFEEIKKEEPSKPTYPITGAQLKLIFPGTEQSRCDEVAKLINKYSNKFEINTRLRMAHFIGQVGIESTEFNAFGNQSGENPCYTSKNMAWNHSAGKTGWIANKTWSEPLMQEGCDDYTTSKTNTRKHPNWNTVNDVPDKYICSNSNPSSVAGENLPSYVYR